MTSSKEISRRGLFGAALGSCAAGAVLMFGSFGKKPEPFPKLDVKWIVVENGTLRLHTSIIRNGEELDRLRETKALHHVFSIVEVDTGRTVFNMLDIGIPMDALEQTYRTVGLI